MLGRLTRRVTHAAVALALAWCGCADAQVSVTTYHNDNLRTGWNSAETVLTPATVGGGSFGLLHTTGLDAQVDAQPLLVAGVNVAGRGKHDVAYVATENDTIYGIDATSGAVLLSRTLGTPVPEASATPGNCAKISDVLGIDSTPVIDASTGTLYTITYGLEDNAPVYRLHALKLTDLSDATPSVLVMASQQLADGSSYQFSSIYSRQRPALLLSGGNVYAGFGGFCDHNTALTRGWVLGWHAATLMPLATQRLINRKVTEAKSYFLTSIWMSGYGLAADAAGSVYFVTGNTDKTGHGYDSDTNPSESVVKLAPDLSAQQDFFTPGGSKNGAVTLDVKDSDFGAGGLMLLPPQAGSVENLAAAAGKVGIMYLLNANALGGYVPDGPDRDVDSAKIGQCWCGQSYFTGADGAGRIVSSGGLNAIVWKVRTAPRTSLKKESASAALPTTQAKGFFTSVSSNGTQAGTAVIWAVARPNAQEAGNVTLLAFDAATTATLFSTPAGPWPFPSAHANIVPVVANGHVYVASYKQLTIFGLSGNR